MKYNIILLILLLSINPAISQKQADKIEIRQYQRIDWYPEFSYSITGRPSMNDLTMRGISWGVISNYKLSVAKNTYLSAGLGFYKYSFNKLKNINSVFGKGYAREIDYPSTSEPVFTTDKYFYSSIDFNIGGERCFDLNSKTTLVAEIEFHTYYTFSQNYHLAGNRDINYKKKEGRFFGHSALISSSLLKKIDNIQIGPTLIIPVFDTWKQDNVFPQESSSANRSKLFRGIGLGISCNFFINQ